MQKLLWLISLLLLCSNAYAACSGSSPQWTAASSSYTDVNACLTAASAGDYIFVPAGTSSWSSQLAITKAITIIGAGKGCPYACNGATTITNTSGNNLISFNPGTGSADLPFRISGFTFNDNGATTDRIIALTGSGSGWHTAHTKIRIDHNKFTNINTSSSNNIFIEVSRYYTGVIDSNYFDTAFYALRFGFSPNNCSSSSVGDMCWWWNNFPIGDLSTNGTSMYLEDNFFNPATDGGVCDCIEGFPYSARYNTIGDGDAFDIHGNNAAQAGCKFGHFYGNNFTGGGKCVDIRGGQGNFFYNKSASCNIQIRDEQVGTTASAGTWVGPYVGSGPLVCPNDDGSCQDTANVYIWNNRIGNTGSKWSIKDPFVDPTINCIGAPCNNTPPCSGSSGGPPCRGQDYFSDSGETTPAITCGTLANRPATCTPATTSQTGQVNGQGYWATNQSCTNLSGMTGVGPTTPIVGTLYKCIATNTWDSGTTPLTYPHPLRNIDTPAAPTNLH